jgi:hypothetical protein
MGRRLLQAGEVCEVLWRLATRDCSSRGRSPRHSRHEPDHRARGHHPGKHEDQPACRLRRPILDPAARAASRNQPLPRRRLWPAPAPQTLSAALYALPLAPLAQLAVNATPDRSCSRRVNCGEALLCSNEPGLHPVWMTPA